MIHVLLATLLCFGPEGLSAVPAVLRVGPLDVAVCSAGFARNGWQCAAARSQVPVRRCFVVTTQVSAPTPETRLQLQRCALVDVQGRRFRPVHEEHILEPGTKSFAFEVPEHAAIVTFELDGVSFAISHVGAREETDPGLVLGTDWKRAPMK